ncbi:MAG: hypothetical protein LQ343_005488 [Gyalolechia ehrenbergii]|nr:MAG: hypothetical protein LQ343_005488 [Gyalolechia ehrenbergii]
MARTVKVAIPSTSADQRRNRGTTANQSDPVSSSATIVNDALSMHGSSDQERNGNPVIEREAGSEAHVDDSSNTVDSDSDAGLELLGKGMKAFVTVVQDLRDLGVEELVLPLPKICVLGDQSTGKSSLIEGISGIKVPRNSGTCTRCPLEINLSTCDPGSFWRCSIFIQKSYIYEGSQVLAPVGRRGIPRGEGATRARPLGPWLAQSFPESFLFYRTDKRAEIPEALHLAQLAILNPGTDHVKYIPGKANVDERIQVKFSPNVVRVDISAPDVQNLSFYDLPGVINQAEVPEEEYLVKLVANLVKSYIKTENCINLLALPMTDDAANSTASKLVQELNAQNRTIGVLTKPDRVQSGESLAQWIDILNGKKFKLGHGYFVVKNNPDPRVSHLVARQEEEEFFNENEPWANTLRTHHERFGTPKLQGVLSKRLTAEIRTSLPQIRERIHSKTAEVVARLKELPEPPEGNLSFKIYEKILAFERQLHAHLDGGAEVYPFQKEWHAAAMRFRDTIALSFPRLNLSDPLTTSQTPNRLAYRLSATPTPTGQRSGVIAIDSDEEDATQPLTPTPQSKRKQMNHQTPQPSPPKRPRLSEIPKHVPTQDSITSSSDSSSVDRSAPHAKRFTLTEIRNILQDAHIGLPNQVDPKAIKTMIKASLTGWDEPLKELLRFAHETCIALILERASEVFGIWRGTQLFELIEEICKSFFEERLNRQVLSAERSLDMERQQALTLHGETMRAASDRAYVTLDNGCRKARAKALLNKRDPGWDDNLNERAKEEKISKVTDAQLGPNPYVHELRAISDVRGYYQCAFSRFVDVVYQGVQADLFTSCRNELGSALKHRIGLEDKDAEQRCSILLAVDPEGERIRVELMKQKANLEKASKWLEAQTYFSDCSASLGVWPENLPFQAKILYSSPSAYLNFISLNRVGTPQDTEDFVHLCQSEIHYLLGHQYPGSRGPGVLTVFRRFTDVFLECGRVYGPMGLDVWSMDLAISTLNTIRGLVEFDGFREYKFEVIREDGKKWMVCRMWMHNPFDKSLVPAASEGHMEGEMEDDQ